MEMFMSYRVKNFLPTIDELFKEAVKMPNSKKLR